MNEYKELVKNLNKNIYGQCSEYCKDIAVLYKEAADAIEQLVRERDAAIHDLEMAVCGQESYPCRYCASYGINPIDVEDVCKTCTDCDKWEWRGVQNE